jgi:hypothetical protein
VEPYRPLSLWEIMKSFHPESFLDLIGLLGFVRLMPNEINVWLGVKFQLATRLPTAPRDDVLGWFAEVERECTAHGFNTSAITARKAVSLFSRSDVDMDSLRLLAHELHGRLRDEMKATMFLALSMRDADVYAKPREGWDAVIAKFPSAVVDIEDAGKCLGLNRYTACVFHLMRVMEVGLRSLGKSLNDPKLDPKLNPSWDRILSRCDTELQKPRADRSPEWRADDIFFSTSTANLRAVKDAWRNPGLHVEKQYTGEEAEEIWVAVRGFMRHLASKLSERS